MKQPERRLHPKLLKAFYSFIYTEVIPEKTPDQWREILKQPKQEAFK